MKIAAMLILGSLALLALAGLILKSVGNEVESYACVAAIMGMMWGIYLMKLNKDEAAK